MPPLHPATPSPSRLPTAALALLLAATLGASAASAFAQGRRHDADPALGDRSPSGRIGASEGNGLLVPGNVPALPSGVGTMPPVVVADRGFLFVVRGATMYKVDESNLRVVASGPLGKASTVRPAKIPSHPEKRPVGHRRTHRAPRPSEGTAEGNG